MAKKKNDNQAVALPSSVVKDDWHAKLITWVNEADDSTDESRELAQKCRDYYDSKQISPEDASKLKKRKQPPIIINRIKPKMDALMGMEKAAKTTAKAMPRTPKHEKGAEAGTESVRFVLQDNSFDQIRSAVWDNILVEGTGGGEVIVEPGQGDEMRVTINHLMWDRLIWDPYSRRKDFSDARFLGQVIWSDYDDAIRKFPKGKEVLETQQTGSAIYDDKPRWMDNTRRRCKIVELYYQKDGEIWYACFTRGGYLKDPQKSPYINEEKETEWPYEFASAFVTREGERYGAVTQLLDVQDEINKRREKALHLMSVRQTFGTAGAVADLNKARQELARPDGHVEFAYGEFGKDFGILPTGDMAEAQFKLLTEAKMEIDAVGANAATQGKDHSIQSGRALIERRNAGQTEVGPMFDVLRHWQYRVFRKVWNRIRQYWKAEKWIRVTDDEHNLRWVGLNAPVTKGQLLLEDAQSKGLPPEQLQQMQMQIQADPAMQEVVDTKNMLAELDVDIIISEVPDVLTQQVEDFQVLGEMVKSGFQLPPLAVIEASPFASTTKEKMIKQMKENPPVPPQVQKQMEQMQEGMEKAGEEIKKLTQENQALKQDQQTEMAELSLQQAKQEGEAQLARAKAEAEFSLKKYMAEQEILLAQMKCDGEKQMNDQKMQIEEKKARDSQKLQAEKLHFEKFGSLDYEKEKEMEREEVKALQESVDGMREGLEGVNQGIATMNQGLTDVLGQILQVLMNPPARQVSIGGVQRDANGQISGANVSTRLQ